MWDNALTGPFGLIAEYSLLKVFRLFLLLTSHNGDIALKTILPFIYNISSVNRFDTDIDSCYDLTFKYMVRTLIHTQLPFCRHLFLHSSRMRTARSLPYGGVFSVRKTPPPVDRQMPVKILPCPKLRLRAVVIIHLYYSTPGT